MRLFARTVLCVLPLAACQPNPSIRAAEPATFNRAAEQVTAEVDTLRAAWSECAALREQIAVEPDPKAKADLQKLLDKANQSVVDSKKRILTHVDAALKLADANVPVDQVNRMRYLQSFINYDDGDYVSGG